MSCANRLVLITCLIAFSIQINEATKLDRLNPALLLELFNRYETQDDAPLSSFGNSIINQDAEESLRSVSNPFRYASNRIAKDFDGFAPIDETESNELLQEPARTSNIELSFNGPSNNANPFISHGIRDQEALEHSALWRHQMMQGGAGEGQQRLKPDGSVKNVQVVKSDAMLPAYCTPPNPCPPGYTGQLLLASRIHSARPCPILT